MSNTVNVNTNNNIVTVNQGATEIISVSTPGPRGVNGPAGPAGPTGSIDSGSFATTGSNVFIGDQTITGSLLISGSSTFTNIGPAIFSGSTTITGSLNITGSLTISGSGDIITSEDTGSFVTNSQTSSFVTNSQTGSFATTGSNSFTGSLDVSGSLIITGSILISGSGDIITSNDTGSFVTNSQTGSFVTNSQTGSFATTGSNSFTGSLDISGSLTITGSLTVSGSGTFNNIGPFNQTGESSFIGNITSSGNISASGDIIGDTIKTNTIDSLGSGFVSIVPISSSQMKLSGVDANSGIYFANLSDKPIFHTFNDVLTLGSLVHQTPIKLLYDVTASANISASAIIQAGTIQSNGVSTAKTRVIIDPGTGNGAQLEMSSAGNLAIATDEGGTLTSTTFLSNNVIASNNISASGEMGADSLRVENRASGVTADVIISGSTFDGDSRDAQIIYPNHGLHFNSDNGTHNHVLALASNGVGIRRQPADANNALEVSGSIQVIDGDIFGATNITASGHGLFQAGKPIITHTSSPISSSLANAGKYHIVGGTLTASIVLDSNAPVGAEYEFFQTSSAGQFLFESASGTTVISKNGSLRLAQQGSSAVLKKVSTTTFHLMGDLT
jgi:hypothetical protein